MEKEKIVLKWGSESVTNNFGMDEDVLNHAAYEIAGIRDRYDAVVVSSGAVAVGKTLDLPDFDGQSVHERPSLQSYAMMGAARYSIAWQNALIRHGIASGQLMVTENEIDSALEKPVLEEALADCFKWGIVPVVNENDALSIKELAELAYGGDNDGIAGHIAELISANTLIIYTGKGGLMDDNWDEIRQLYPGRYKWAKTLVEHRERRKASDKKGRGGMTSKLDICIKSASLGIKTYIAKVGSPIDDILKGETGTEIVAKDA